MQYLSMQFIQVKHVAYSTANYLSYMPLGVHPYKNMETTFTLQKNKHG